MTRVVTFVDGFESTGEPSIAGGAVAVYDLDNNTSDSSLVAFAEVDEYTSVFVDYEIQRSVTGTLYRQAGTMIATFDGTTYSFTAGSYMGDDLLLTSGIPSGEQVKLFLFENGLVPGQWDLYYSTGDMAGASHSCKVKLSTTKIRAA